MTDSTAVNATDSTRLPGVYRRAQRLKDAGILGISRNASQIVLCLIFVLLPATTLPSAHGQSRAVAQQPLGSFLGVDGSKIYYEECGTGPEAVVLIHDGIAHSVVWDGLWPAFCKQFHTIRYDRRGYGRSPVTTQPYFETDDLQALMRNLQIKRGMLVGSSHGGALAINFTLEHPALVEQLVLVGAVVDGYGFSDHFLMRTMKNEAPMQNNDVPGLITNWTSNKYVIAADHPEAKKKLSEILTASPPGPDARGYGQTNTPGCRASRRDARPDPDTCRRPRYS